MGKLTRTILVAAFALAATLAIAPAAFASTYYMDADEGVEITGYPSMTYKDTFTVTAAECNPDLVFGTSGIRCVPSVDENGTARWTWKMGYGSNFGGSPSFCLYAYPSGNADCYGDYYAVKYGSYAEFDIPIEKSALSDFDAITLADINIKAGQYYEPTVKAKAVGTNGRTITKNVTEFCTLKFYTTENNAVGNVNGKTTITTPGTYWVKITGNKVLKGTMIKKITVKKEVTVKVNKRDFFYDGKYHKPTVSVYYGTKKLTKDVSYTIVSNKSHKASGTYTISLKGKGNYAGCAFSGTKWKIWPKKTFGSSTAAWGNELTVGKDLPAGIYRFKATEGKVGKICIHNNEVQTAYDVSKEEDDPDIYATQTLSFSKFYYVDLKNDDKIKSCNARYTRIDAASYSLKSTIYGTNYVAMYKVGKDLKAGTYRLTGTKSSGTKGTYKVVQVRRFTGSTADFESYPLTEHNYKIVKSGTIGYKGTYKRVSVSSGQYLIINNAQGKKL